MAQGLRTRLALTLALVLPGCSEEPAPPLVRYASPDELVAAVLEHCHGPLEGMDRVVMTLAEDDKVPADKINLWLPDRMLVESGDEFYTLNANGGWRRLRGGLPAELDGDELARLVELRDSLRGVLLIPLYESVTVTADGSGLLLELANGERWHLELQEGSLLPATLKGPGVEVVFLEFLTTSKTHLPQRVSMGSSGERQVRFHANDVEFAPEYFDVVPVRPGVTPTQIGPISWGGERHPETPEITRIPAVSWLELEDPGDWQRRHELAAESHRELREHQQLLQGFSGFVADGDRRLMIIPFSADPERGDRPLDIADGRTVRQVPDHRALVVYPEPGSFSDAVASGSEQLLGHARRNDLHADGAIRAFPYLFLGEELPTDDDLKKVIVRLELPIK